MTTSGSCSSNTSLTDELASRFDSYRDLIDCANAIVWRADAQTFEFTFVSPYAQTLLGYPLQQWISEPTFWKDHIHPDDRESAVALCLEATKARKPHQLAYRMIAADGRVVWLFDLVHVVTVNDEPKELVGVMIDISERKRLRDQLQQERDRLRLLLDLSHQLVSKLDLREFFDTVLEGVRRLADWQWATILLPDPASQHLTVYLSPDNSYLQEGYTVPIDDSLQGKVYRSGKPVAFRIEDLPNLCSVYRENQWMQDIARSEHIRAGCSLPLIHEAQVIGVLFLMTSIAQDPAKSDLKFLQELATLIAATLHNSLRFESVNESRARLISERQYIEAEFLRERGIAEIIGDSPEILEVLRQVSVVAPTDSTVLITGETGTGKELIARAIHEQSARHQHSFIKVDCAAIPATLMESELFGHDKGSFTGATAQKLGRFEIADHGTLFLDEVGEIPLELQPKLLRVLQDHAFERLGSNRTRKLDIRIITATHRNLEKMVEQGTLREDLYYRLKVFPISIPCLRDRASDIPALVQYYVAMYARRMGKEIPVIPASAMEAFLGYCWPGNIRELQHFIERSVVLTPGRQLQAPLAELQRFSQRQAAHRRPASGRTLEQIERDSILQALEDSNWVVGGPNGAAAKLGMKRTTLASRLEKLGIARPSRGSKFSANSERKLLTSGLRDMRIDSGSGRTQ